MNTNNLPVAARLDTDAFLTILQEWDKYFPRRVRFVACGQAALALQDLAPFPVEIGLMIAEESEYLAAERTLKRLGYRACTRTGWARRDGRIFDLLRAPNPHNSETAQAPLPKGNSILFKEFNRSSLSVLNDFDLILGLLVRGDPSDVDDCAALVRARGAAFDFERLRARFAKAAKADPNPARVLGNLKLLSERLEEGRDVRR